MAGIAFTVLLPVWAGDDPDHFREAARSIAAQTLAPAETLICQDGELPEALRAAVDEATDTLCARLAHNPGARGLHHNLNHALAQVRTPWVARCDADDLNAPGRFEAQAAFLTEHPDTDVLGGDLVEFWPDGRERRKLMPLTHEEIVRYARWRSPINHNTVVYRVDAVLGAGGYPDLPHKEDYALWLRLIGAGAWFANLRSDLVRARLGQSFYRRRTGVRNLKSEWQIYKLRRASPGLGGAGAVAALAARSVALATNVSGRVVYEWALRSRQTVSRWGIRSRRKAA
jgi:glycosyltransferase involved in cell wall biosynthesis